MTRKVSRKDIAHVVEVLLEADSVKKATLYVAPDMVIKGALPHRIRANGRSTTLVLTVGKPNYAERQFIKACKGCGEPFPVKKLQLKFWPGRRAR